MNKMYNPLDHKKCKRAAIVLAGGDGTHLHKVMDFTTWHSVPKQFCTLTGGETLLEQTVHRVARIIPLRKTAIVVNRAHREFYEGLSGVPASSIVTQPSNRGTVPAILYGLRRLANLGRNTVVAVFPCDHCFGSDDRFIHHVEEAMSAVESSPSCQLSWERLRQLPKAGLDGSSQVSASIRSTPQYFASAASGKNLGQN